MRWAGACGVIQIAIWWGQLLNRRHKYYGMEDVSQDRENPARSGAIIPVERKERKSVWRFVTSRSLCFRKGVGSALLRNVLKKKKWVMGSIFITCPTRHKFLFVWPFDRSMQILFLIYIFTSFHLSWLIRTCCSWPKYATSSATGRIRPWPHSKVLCFLSSASTPSLKKLIGGSCPHSDPHHRWVGRLIYPSAPAKGH